MREHNSTSLATLNQQLIHHGVEAVVQHLVGDNYTRNGTTLSMASYAGGKSGGSFQVAVSGKNAGYWFENNPADAPNGRTSGDLVELWCLNMGVDKAQARKDIQAFLGGQASQPPHRPALTVIDGSKGSRGASTPARVAKTAAGLGPKPAARTTLEKYARQLRNHPAALAYLEGERGLQCTTIEHFGLGLSSPYKQKSGVVQDKALVFPIMDRQGQFVSPYAYYNIPGVTENPQDHNGWCIGSPQLSYNQAHTNQDVLVVVEGFKDLWRLHQALSESDLLERVLIVTSTHGARVPEAVVNQTLRMGISKVYLAFDADPAGEDITRDWAQYTGTQTYRLRPPLPGSKEEKDWSDYFALGHTAKDFARLLTQAEQIVDEASYEPITNIKQMKKHSRYAPTTLDISCSYVNGVMYYPVWVIKTGEDKDGNMTLDRRIEVVSSKREMQWYRTVGTKYGGEPIYTLKDGTLMNSQPKVPATATWQFEDIQRWLNGHTKVRPLASILKDIERYLRGQVWLPNDDDYVVLACTIMVTYTQSIFDAVPLILATGSAGTGKSHLGQIMARLGCNSTILGDTSAATITRILDETRGFLVLDDVEKINKTMNTGNIQADDFLQILKVSYKKETAIRAITDMKTMSVKMLNSYGVKFLTNTVGIEEILGTRTIQIPTRRAPEHFRMADEDLAQLGQLRAELHAFTMDHCQAFEAAYVKYPTSNRVLEITAPLRAVVDVAGLSEWHDVLDRVVERMASNKPQSSALDYLKDSVLHLGSLGYQSLTIEHVMLEMRSRIPANFGKQYTTEIADWEKLDWLRQQLIALGWIESASIKRIRPWKTHNPQSLYRLTCAFKTELAHYQSDCEPSDQNNGGMKEPEIEDVIKENLLTLKQEKGDWELNGHVYCKQFSHCSQCPYYSVDCAVRKATNKP